MSRILTHIVEQHAEEAEFLGLLREKAVDAPHYKRLHLARLDERVEAHVDGLRVAGEAGREIAWRQLEQWGEMGELFAAAVTLVETGDPDLVAPCVDFAEQHPESLRGLVGAIAWTAPERLGHLVRTWLDSARPFERYLGVAACSVHRVDPHSRLGQLVEDRAPMVRARALRLMGELGRTDRTEVPLRIMDTEADDTTRFWAAWSLALLTGSPRAVAELQKVALGPAPEAAKAFDLALRTLPLDDAKAWLRALNGDPAQVRQVVIGLGVVGDPVAVSWLVDRMRDPALARVAGESLSMITGVDIAYCDLDSQAPEGFTAEPMREPAEIDIAPDPDERLPWPDPAKMEAWWASEGHRFASGHRYLVGAQIARDVCERAWAESYQRQRCAAAYELLRLEPRLELRNWKVKISNSDLQLGEVFSHKAT
jgi:uncharacterized protein (TIGR02270 family)